MFYSPELLSLRRKGRLARCWLAATISEKMFKKTIKSSTIEKINVAELCEEILSTIQVESNRTYGRFSLYLSSQLMYGATKILFYQAQKFQDYLFTANWKMCVGNSHEAAFNLAMTLKIPNVPPVTEILRVNIAADKYLITEDPYTSVMEHKMQEELNFGILTDYEMEEFLLPPQVDEQFLNEVRRFSWDQPPRTSEEFLLVPPVDLNNQEETIGIEKEVQTPFARREEFVVDVEDAEFERPPASRKRTATSLTEIPTKRRKMGSEKELALPAEVPAPPDAPSLVLEGPPIPVPAEAVVEPQESLVQNLTSVLPTGKPDHVASVSENIEVTLASKSRRRKIFDNTRKLSDAIMQKCIANVTAHTKDYLKFVVTLPSAKKYLKQPCSKISHRIWADKLIKLYSQHTVSRCIIENEFSDLEIDLSLTTHEETVRVDASKIQEKTYETSSKLAIPPAEISEQSKIIENVNLIEDFQINPLEQEIQEFLATPPKIIDFGRNIGEITELSQRQLNEQRRNSKSKTSSSFSYKAHITKEEIKMSLQIHWNRGTIAKFHNIISPDNYTKIDAAYTFQCCLELQAEKYLVLKQREPFDTIWIEKTLNNSSETGDE